MFILKCYFITSNNKTFETNNLYCVINYFSQRFSLDSILADYSTASQPNIAAVMGM